MPDLSVRSLFIMVCFLGGLLTVPYATASQTPDLRGQFVQGGLVVGKTEPGADVLLEGEALKVSEEGYFVFGFGRDESGLRKLEVSLNDGARWEQKFEIQQREFDIQRVDGVPQHTVTPDEAVQAQIRKDAERVWIGRQPRTDRVDFAGDFIWPAEGRISGVYGSQRILNGEPRAPHYGLDVAAPTGTPVIAPAAGTVTMTDADMVLSGGTIIVDHGHGIFSTFLHLSAIHVEEGEEIHQGQQIGEIGATGRATGPHLDWRINWGQVRVDPQLLVPPRD